MAWASQECLRALGNRACFPRSPEICVEVFSPGNSPAEMREKLALYLDAGAQEVWFCTTKGVMTFQATPQGRLLRASRLCPAFPNRIVLS